MRQTNLQGEVVKEWLAKWPNLPSKQLARMIYNSDDNNKLFNSAEHVRTSIRYYRGGLWEQEQTRYNYQSIFTTI